MDQNIQKALWLGVGIMMFVAIVSTGLFLFNKGKTLADASGSQLDAMSEQLAGIQYEKFDNTHISGGDLLNAIKQYKTETGKFFIDVTLKNNSNKRYISGGGNDSLSALSREAMNEALQNAQDSSSTSYINPQGSFLTELVYDSNDVVKGIKATQK